jgi:hypothetical protein
MRARCFNGFFRCVVVFVVFVGVFLVIPGHLHGVDLIPVLLLGLLVIPGHLQELILFPVSVFLLVSGAVGNLQISVCVLEDLQIGACVFGDSWSLTGA